MSLTMLKWIFPALLCLQPLNALADALPFRAEYVVRQGPVKARAAQELVQLEDGSYRLTSSARALLLRIKETSEFDIIEGQIVPKAWQYKRSGIGRKNESMLFDWESKLASHGETSSPVSPGTLDQLSYQYQLRMDVARQLEQGTEPEKISLEYIIADGEKRKEYRFDFAGEEVLSTPLGEMRTILFLRAREGSKRRTTLWLAPDHDCLLIRLRQEKDGGKTHELNLKTMS